MLAKVVTMPRSEGQSQVDKAKSYEQTSYAMYGLAACAIVTSVTLFAVTTGPNSKAETPNIMSTPFASDGYATMAVQGRYCEPSNKVSRFKKLRHEGTKLVRNINGLH